MAEEKSGNNPVIVSNTGDFQKPLNLLQAISEIQHVAALETNMEEPLNNNFLSVKQRIDFMAVGFKNGMLNGLIAALLTPISLGVLKEYIPIFGDHKLTFFDEVYAFLLTIGFSLGFAIFLSSLRKCYVGTISKGMIRNLFGGMFAGILIKVMIVFLLYNWIFIELTPQHVYSMLAYIHKYFPNANLVPAYYWILKFKTVFPESIVIVALTSMLVIVIPLITLFITIMRNKVQKEELIDE